MKNMKSLINGKLFEKENALISLEERGFRFGDGIFETIAIYNRNPYLLNYHFERLQAGLEALRIKYFTQGLKEQIRLIIEENNLENAMIRVYISRGIGSLGYMPTGDQPTLVIESLDLPSPPSQAVDLILSSYEKISLKALPVNCKIAQGLNLTLVKIEAAENNCYDGLQLNPQGEICETSSANIFWVKDDILHTPSLDCGILAGVTRRRIIEFSPYKVMQGSYKIADLQNADAVFITNSANGVIAVKSIKNLGFTWQSENLAKEFQELRNEDIVIPLLNYY